MSAASEKENSTLNQAAAATEESKEEASSTPSRATIESSLLEILNNNTNLRKKLTDHKQKELDQIMNIICEEMVGSVGKQGRSILMMFSGGGGNIKRAEGPSNDSDEDALLTEILSQLQTLVQDYERSKQLCEKTKEDSQCQINSRIEELKKTVQQNENEMAEVSKDYGEESEDYEIAKQAYERCKKRLLDLQNRQNKFQVASPEDLALKKLFESKLEKILQIAKMESKSSYST